MLGIGFVITGIAAIFNSKIIMVCVSAGYLGGFFLGLLYGVDSYDQNGVVINDWWVKWMVSFIIIIVIGIFWELFCKILEERKK